MRELAGAQQFLVGGELGALNIIVVQSIANYNEANRSGIDSSGYELNKNLHRSTLAIISVSHRMIKVQRQPLARLQRLRKSKRRLLSMGARSVRGAVFTKPGKG